MKKLILAVVLAATTILGVAAPTNAVPAPRVVATTFTACDGSSAYLGNRVCIDKTTAFGPVALIFDTSTHLYGSFGLCGSAGLVSSAVGTMYEWVWDGGYNTHMSGIPYGGSYVTLYTDAGSGDAYDHLGTCGNAANANALAFFANSAGYELVIAN